MSLSGGLTAQSPRLYSVLYIGPISGTCLDRANAIRRLGHPVVHLDLRDLLPPSVWIDRITWRLGGDLFSLYLTSRLSKRLAAQRFDICYVDGGELVTPRIVSKLREHASSVVNYNIDDPLGPRDGFRFKAYRQSLAHYDLNVVVRTENVPEAKALGARKVMRVFRSADEVTHAPRQLSMVDRQTWGSEVLFLGTWFPERGPFLCELIHLGVPLTIRGPNWHKAPEWSKLKRYWKGGSIAGDEYAKAIQCAKVNLGLLSKENRDLHTTRSLEIPALASLLCAERTSEHLSMYDDGREALFWNDAEECAAACRFALADEVRRRTISEAGHRRLKQNGHYNEKILASILASVDPSA